MYSKRELLNAIAECETGLNSYQNCQKLATLYTLYDHSFADHKPKAETVREQIIDDYGDSEFLQAVAGKQSEQVWKILDEMVSAVQVLQPKLYDAVLLKLKE